MVRALSVCRSDVGMCVLPARWNYLYNIVLYPVRWRNLWCFVPFGTHLVRACVYVCVNVCTVCTIGPVLYDGMLLVLGCGLDDVWMESVDRVWVYVGGQGARPMNSRPQMPDTPSS